MHSLVLNLLTISTWLYQVWTTRGTDFICPQCSITYFRNIIHNKIMSSSSFSSSDNGGDSILSSIWVISHPHTPLTTFFLGLSGWAGTRKVKPIWILLKQEIGLLSGSGISWAICKSAPHSRQITMPAPHHSVFYRPDALPAAQPTASKHWRPVTMGNITWWYKMNTYKYLIE